ncbi:PEP/pyruvate-binding domain-containing protein [Bacteroidota bacterium]
MSNNKKPIRKIIDDLKERAKELNCLYKVQELLNDPRSPLSDICKGIVANIPPGWQYSDICKAKITYENLTFQSTDFVNTPWVQNVDIIIQENVRGQISVYYTEEMPEADEGPFLKEERKLLNTIAEQFGLYVLHNELKEVFQEEKESKQKHKSEWWIILDLLKKTDPKLLTRISRKMVNYLCWSGVKDAEQLLKHFSPSYKEEGELMAEINRPYRFKKTNETVSYSDDIFELACKHIGEAEIFDNIQKWITEDKSSFLVNVIENPDSPISKISDAIERYHYLSQQGLELPTPREKGFQIALIRRLMTGQPRFISIAKQYISLDDFNELFHHLIHPVESHGRLGGKSSGLFLATRILKKLSDENELFRDIKTPKTWYITSDGILDFINYNNLEDITEQKYKDIDQIRQEYPFVVDLFKNSSFSQEIIKNLSIALDDFGDVPLVIRSSSLLEDSMGAAFAGKYKSLFIANQGSHEERLIALMDAIAEVYASTFGPDPIEYRIEHGLADYHEEMGILIQEVVGTKVGKYYFPSLAGVALSNNEFPWSSRIKRENGVIRIVPGLGTRAVDRLSNDYPILIAPGQPNLRVNVTLDEIIRYSPKEIDLINLETGSFETKNLDTLFKEIGRDYPYVNKLISLLKENHLHQPRGLGIDFEKEQPIVTFEGLIKDTPFIKQIHTILQVLQEKLETPVDIEFAFKGADLYLLQCRPQSYRKDSKPAVIPKEIPDKKIIFSANRFISNGTIPDLTHIVYVNPQKYSDITNHSDLLAVGRVIGRLNKILPKRKFILMGPGRWGSRGDIKLGVNVTYSEINNTSMLIEIARKQKNYVPDLSFGTHFFQDLVEASIRYLPLYPDDPGIIFKEEFLTNSKNLLNSILPDYNHLEDTIRVVDVPTETNGLVLQVLMNADKQNAIGLLAEPSKEKKK